jgi:hypothetical protein
MTAAKRATVTSIQAKRKGGYKTSTARLNDKTRKGAHRAGMAWDDDEVSRLARGIDKDETTFEMAMALSRTLYGVMNARAHIAFAMRHQNAIFGRKR